ncbi:MAG: Lrp/AsnC family transcriptional regulator [Planctomycetes bacterium]|nr:Lrp/AsnC family transcriptional regulator [Planctomycetota bacterium]
MHETDRKLLDRLQGSFPLVPRPFAAIGGELGLADGDALQRVARLHREGLIRRIGPVLDPEKVGRVGALVAMSVPEDRLEAVAAAVSAFPTVTHNYQRVPLAGSCPYNLWFTLTAPSHDALAEAVASIEKATGLPANVLPVRRKFKIGVRFDFGAGGASAPRAAAPRGAETPRPQDFDGLDRLILGELQDGLPFVPEPYAEAAARLGMSVEELLGRLAAMIQRGEVRRFGASIAHRRAGIKANVMCVWRVPPEALDAFAREAVRFDAITHCYERAATPEWPYNVYAMIHGRTQARCEAVIRDLCRLTGQTDHVALLSTREFKKTWTRL